MPQYEFEIGSTYEGMTNVEALTVALPAPRSYYQQYAMRVEQGNGVVRGLGLPSASWSWGFLSLAQRNQLRTFCTAGSAAVYIKTKKRDETEVYDVFTAIMIWPDDEEVTSSKLLDFTVEFKKLVAYDT